MPVTGTVFNIARGSLHDGPGIRTVVYMKGCSLRCLWCHNPEGFTARPQLIFYEDRCAGCGRCAAVCGRCHAVENGRAVLNREACEACGRCAAVCPAGALEMCGETMTPGQVFEVVAKDKEYYEQSGGGVTFSGGECFLQPEFLKATLALCKQNGIRTVVETALHVPFQVIEGLLPLIDMVMADFKHPDSEKHRQYTGAGNETILDNLKKIAPLHKNILVRIPVIPGVNDGGALERAVRIVAETGGGITGIELLKYNNLYRQKYRNLGLEPPYFSGETQSGEAMKALCAALGGAIGKEGFVTFRA